ncbi:MAG: c-type cytochrome, partial [Beijerinckiaceae bacterium]
MRIVYLCLIFWLGLVISTQAADDAEMGRRIFRQGADGKQACAGCHGRDGLGSREGDSEAPPIRWDILSREMNYQGDDALNRALSQGISPSGAQLSGKMPRYFLSADAHSDLAAYLKHIAAEDQRGITIDTVTIGVGVADSNDPLLSLLANSTETLTRGHSIYGRRVVYTPVQADAVSSLSHGQAYLAIIGWPDAINDSAAEVFARAGIPNVMPRGLFVGTENPQDGFGLFAPLTAILREVDQLAPCAGHTPHLIVADDGLRQRLIKTL